MKQQADLFQTKTPFQAEQELSALQLAPPPAGPDTPYIPPKIDPFQTYYMRNSFGRTEAIPGTNVHSFFQEGWMFETPKQTAVRSFIQDFDDGKITGIKAIPPSLQVGMMQFADEALFGIPELIADHVLTPEQVDLKDAIKKEHWLTNAVGGLAGFGANVAASTALTGGVGDAIEATMLGGRGIEGAAEATRIAEAASEGISGFAQTEALASRLVGAGVERELAAKVAPTLFQKTMAAAISHGAQGGLVVAPTAITEAALGDPEAAGEHLLAGIGLGATLGIAGKLIGNKGAQLAEKYAAQKAETAEAEIIAKQAKEAGLELHPDIEKLLNKEESLLSKGFGKGIEFLATMVGGRLGYGAAKGVNWMMSTLSFQKAFGKIMDTLPEMMVTIGKGSDKGAVAGALSLERLASDLTHKEVKDEQLAYRIVSDHLFDLVNNPQKLSDNLARTMVNDDGGAAGILSAYGSKQSLAIQYLANAMPKINQAPQPFSTFLSPINPAELRHFSDKLGVVGDPYLILGLMQKGTLNKHHMDAIVNVYPKIYYKIAKEINRIGLEQQKSLSFQQKQIIGTFLGSPIVPSMRKERMKMLQTPYASPQGNPPKKSGGMKLPDTTPKWTKVGML